MKKETGEGMFRRYEVRDQQGARSSAEAPPLSHLAQAQIGRRLGATLWTPAEDAPDTFEQALVRIRKALS
jgi:hypothetical protein